LRIVPVLNAFVNWISGRRGSFVRGSSDWW